MFEDFFFSYVPEIYLIYTWRKITETIEYIDDTTLIELHTTQLPFVKKPRCVFASVRSEPIKLLSAAERLLAISGWLKWLNTDRRGIIGALNGKQARNEADR